MSVLGEGGMGVVFRANDKSTGDTVAVKMLKFDRASLGDFHRFKREGKLISKLNHQNIVKVLDVDFDDSSEALIVMECLDGINLSQAIRTSGHLQMSDAIEYAIQLCNGVEHAHTQNIIHRDLKPSNIMLVQGSPDSTTAKILDFGIAKTFGGNLRDETLTRTGELFGSPPYMSPEQAQGFPLDYRSDIYSMGCILYEMLTGVPPLAGGNAFETLMKQIYEKPAPLKEASLGTVFPERLQILVDKSLAKDPSERYQTIAELRSDLQNLETNMFSGTGRDASTAPEKTSKRRVVIAIAGLSICTLFATAYFLQKHSESPAQDRYSKDIAQLRKVPALTAETHGKSSIFSQDPADLDQFTNALATQFKESVKLGTKARVFSASPLTLQALAKQTTLTMLYWQPFEQVDDSVLDCLRNMPLHVLELSGITITDKGCEKLARMAALEELMLNEPKKKANGKQLTKLGLDKLGVLSVTKLTINHSSFEDKDLSFISKLHDLKSLDIEGDRITDGFLPTLKNLSKLSELNCGDNRITDNGLQTLASVSSLESLDLYKNPGIRDEGMKYLASLRLRKLSLEGDNITDGALRQLAKISSLRELSLEDCKRLSPAGLARLRKSLPLCIVKAGNEDDK